MLLPLILLSLVGPILSGIISDGSRLQQHAAKRIKCHLYERPYNNPKLPRDYPLLPRHDIFFQFPSPTKHLYWAECAKRRFVDLISSVKEDKEKYENHKNISPLSYFTSPKARRTPFIIHPKSLGGGGFGAVYSGSWFIDPSGDGVPVAIKLISKASFANSLASLKRDVLGSFGMYAVAPDVTTRILDIYLEHPTHWIIILEKGDIDLFNWIDEHTYARKEGESKEMAMVSEKTLRTFMLPLIQGLLTYSDIGGVHGDIKPENILLFRNKDGSYRAKITDFGASGHRKDPHFGTYPIGTSSYLPKEWANNPQEWNVDPRKALKRYQDVDAFALAATLHAALHAPYGDIITTEHCDEHTSASFFPYRKVSPSLALIFDRFLQPGKWYNDPKPLSAMRSLIGKWKKEPLTQASSISWITFVRK
ncbi:MAG: kinase-like domain-containing protein [Piptocephalis tieghemiana]|nr:MAG: kinase-like domain-containing protein [Piptocephalis tieghemiana]